MRFKQYFLAMCLAACGMAAKAGTVHVDCGPKPERGAVTSLDALNRMDFAPGTQILFKRGATCFGSFTPKAGNSGRPGAPIVVGAFGKGRARPVIAAGCTDVETRPRAPSKTAYGVSPYDSLCRSDMGPVRRAAIHLYNVEHWEIRDLELSNDGLNEGGRTGLLVQLEDFGVGSHYHIRNLFVHHVRGYQKDAPGSGMVYKETGGILFNVTRNQEVLGTRQKPTRYDDVLVEDSEIHHVDAIGLSNRSAWMCRIGGAPCIDYPPYKGHPERVAEAAGEFFPSTGIVFRKNRIHDIGGDGIVVRTASAPRIEDNLLYDIWMRVPGNSAGAWAINTDDALFRRNEVHHVRFIEPNAPGDGMAFDADLGARGTRIVENYSHDNAGGFMLFCGCGDDGLGNPAQSVGTLVEGNVSVNDGRRVFSFAGSASATIRKNLIVTEAPVIEHTGMGSKNAAELRENVFVATSGSLFRDVKGDFDYRELLWRSNDFFGYPEPQDVRYVGQGDRFKPGADTAPRCLTRLFKPAAASDAALRCLLPKTK